MLSDFMNFFWTKIFHEISLKFHDVFLSKEGKYLKSVSKPVKGKCLLFCMNSIMHLLLTSIFLNDIFLIFKSINNEN